MTAEPFEIKIYKKRWLILASFCAIFFWTIFQSCTYGVVNNVIVTYFDTSYSNADWLLSSVFVGTILASPLLAWLSLKQLISSRKLLIVSSLCLIANASSSILVFNKPDLFALLVLGQTFDGISTAACLTATTSLANLWFPESQIGIAIGFVILSGTVATFLANSALPASMYISMNNKTSFQFQSVHQNQSMNNITDLWISHDKTVFEIIFSTELLIGLLVLLYLICFVPEKPDQAPSYAQYLKRSENTFVNQTKTNVINEKDFLKGTKALLTDKVFVLCSVSSGIMFTVIDTEMLIMQQVMHENFLQSKMSPDLLAGLVIVCFNVGSIIGNPMSGKLLDRFKQYYMQSCLGAACYVFFTIGASLTVCYSFIAMVFLFYFLIGFFSRISMISLIDSVMQHTYPRDVVFVSALMAFLQTACTPILIVISRQIFKHFYSAGVLSFFCFVKFIAFSFAVLGKPKLHRLNAEHSQILETSHEETPLVEN